MMYCPSCGKENIETARFCRGCGRSLAGILQTAQADTGSVFERIEYRLDETIASYASRYFKGRAAPFVSPISLKESWKLLGQGFLTVFLDLLYTWLIVEFVLQIRFLMLLFKSPVRWWQERRARKAVQPSAAAPIPLLQEPVTNQLPVASVTEETTERLSDYVPPRERA